MNEVTETSVRAETRAWLQANWDPELGLVEWRNKLADSGWGMPTWPEAWYGRALPHELGAVVEEEFQRIGAIGVARAGIRMLAASTLLEHGSQMHKQKFLRRILTGEDTWCQLFSEPGSGSDLAGASTRADLKDGTWIVNGQKVWTTSAHHAQWGLLLARTDWDLPKHRGLLAARAHLGLGSCCLAANDYDEALPQYLKVAMIYESEEEVAEALWQAGRCLESLEDPQRAAARYRELIEKHPAHPLAQRAKDQLDNIVD